MKALILGSGGMIGRKLAARLAGGALIGRRVANELLLQDLHTPGALTAADCDVHRITSNLSAAEDLVERRPDLIFHLAAVLSGEAESEAEPSFEEIIRIHIEDELGGSFAA